MLSGKAIMTSWPACPILFHVLSSTSSNLQLLHSDKLQGKNITLPECPGQVNFDCGHVDFCCTGPVGMYFLLSFSIKSFTNHTHRHIAGKSKIWACNFCNEAGNFLGHPSIGQVCCKLCSCPELRSLSKSL